MLTQLQIKNFKAWRDTGPVRLAPLTVIFGTNSSGKSSLGHLLLALKQTVQLTDRKRALHLGDDNALIDLGTFADCVYGHDLANTLEVRLQWHPLHAMSVKDVLKKSATFKGEEIGLSACIRADALGQPVTASMTYELMQHGSTQLRVHHERSDTKVSLDCEPLKLVHAMGRKWPLEAPEKFYRFSDRTLARFQNADFLADFALQTELLLDHLYYLGPLRTHPRRIYQWSGDTPPSVGSVGEFTIAALLAATQDGRELNRGYKQRRQRFDVFIAHWLADLGVIHSFEVRPVTEGRKDYEVLIRSQSSSTEVKLTDVGMGVSQVLPALVQAFYAPAGSVVWMEQPEIHLHPMAQANLADAFISAVQAYEDGVPRQMQLIVETHSEHFLTRLQRRVAEGKIPPDDVAVYFVKPGQQGAELEALRMNMFGEIENWPDNFFGDEMGDIAARTLAALDRQSKGGT